MVKDVQSIETRAAAASVLAETPLFQHGAQPANFARDQSNWNGPPTPTLNGIKAQLYPTSPAISKLTDDLASNAGFDWVNASVFKIDPASLRSLLQKASVIDAHGKIDQAGASRLRGYQPSYDAGKDQRPPGVLSMIAFFDGLIDEMNEETDPQNLPSETTVAVSSLQSFEADLLAHVKQAPADPSNPSSVSAPTTADAHTKQGAKNSSDAHAVEKERQHKGRQSRIEAAKRERRGLKPIDWKIRPEVAWRNLDQFHKELATLIREFAKDHPNAIFLAANFDNNDDTTDRRWYVADLAKGEMLTLNWGNNG
jgi:hypothetical protein